MNHNNYIHVLSCITTVVSFVDSFKKFLTGGRSFLVVNNSPLMKLAQMYEFSAESVQEKKKWEEAIEKAMKGTTSQSQTCTFLNIIKYQAGMYMYKYRSTCT